MSWGTELWDQYENISQHTDRGVGFIEKFGSFVKDRCAIENEYAKNLRRLVKNYQPKKKEEEDYQFTHTQAFLKMTNEVNDLAGQHEVIAENLQGIIIKDLQNLIRELKEEKKKCLNEGSRLNQNLAIQQKHLEKSKTAYEKAYKQALLTQSQYEKADADLNLSRAEVEKAKHLAQMRGQQCDDSKSEYANQLQKFNELKERHFTQLMPQVFNALQEMDEKRIVSLQSFMKQSVQVEKNVFPIINTCLDGIAAAADNIDEKSDSKLVIERYKSGFDPPPDEEFEDLTHTMRINHETNTLVHNQNRNGAPAVKHDSFNYKTSGTDKRKPHKARNKIFNIFSNKAPDELKEDFSDYPPQQQKKKLQQKIEKIQTEIAQETNRREGMLKMRSVYEGNTQLGDPHSLDPQLGESGQKLDRLGTELNKFQQYLRDTENKMTPNSQKRQQRNSVSENSSLSRSSSEAQMESNRHNTNGPQHINNNNHHHHDATDSVSSTSGGTPPTHHERQSISPDSGADTELRVPSIAESEDFDVMGSNEFDGEFAVLGTCKALYLFEAENEGSITMVEGETFDLLESDQGDGWTRVRRQTTGEDGFVPTSYIECYLYETNA